MFGCGGDRDKGKRVLMAQAAEQFADKVIITSDNPRSEDPNEIINGVAAGLTHPQNAHLANRTQKTIFQCYVSKIMLFSIISGSLCSGFKAPPDNNVAAIQPPKNGQNQL